jgi:hypothetical protein
MRLSDIAPPPSPFSLCPRVKPNTRMACELEKGHAGKHKIKWFWRDEEW